jgi:hypothetical protein
MNAKRLLAVSVFFCFFIGASQAASPFSNDRTANSELKATKIILDALRTANNPASKHCHGLLTKVYTVGQTEVLVDGKINDSTINYEIPRAVTCALSIGDLAQEIERALMGVNSEKEAINAIFPIFEAKLGERNKLNSRATRDLAVIVSQPDSLRVPYLHQTTASNYANPDGTISSVQGLTLGASTGMSIAYTTSGVIHEIRASGNDGIYAINEKANWTISKGGVDWFSSSAGVFGGKTLSFGNKSNRSYEVSK